MRGHDIIEGPARQDILRALRFVALACEDSMHFPINALGNRAAYDVFGSS
jgi:hypothetical protein